MSRARRRGKPRRKQTLLAEPIPLADPVTIEGIAEGGKGIARVNGKTLFVAAALTGETVSVSITRRHASYDEAVVTEVLDASAQRQQPPCEFFQQCGGCSLQYQLPAAQIVDKQTILLEQLSRIGRVQPEQVAPPLSGDPWGYRGKARLAVRYSGAKKRVLVGFRSLQGNGVAEMDHCLILDPRVSALITPLAEMMNELEGRERMPQIEVATDSHTVVLVFRHIERLSEQDRQILREFGDAHRLRVMLQPAGVDSIHILPPDSADALGYQLPGEQVEIKYFPHQFIQVNGKMNIRMIAQAMQWLDVEQSDRVADLFCGVGNFTLPLARRAARVFGIEGEGDLVKQARSNAQLNNLANVEFRQHDLFTRFGKEFGQFNKLLLDPPRSGAKLICENIEQLQPQRIVYVSCNPATLARDAHILVGQKGYRLVRAGVIDMFPHTSHVESMALFERNG